MFFTQPAHETKAQDEGGSEKKRKRKEGRAKPKEPRACKGHKVI
jgi:hypothetical protein